MKNAFCLLTVFFLSALCQAADPPVETGEERDTLLYVKTDPPGAKVFLDGKELGTSNNTFPVDAGVGAIRVELDGYKPGTKQVTIRSNRITRLELELKPKAETAKQTVEQAVITISQCTEHDPRVEQALKALRPLKQSEVVTALSSYLDSSRDTIRRSAIYILWNGQFKDITPAVAALEKLLSHEEMFTRGMAALALGRNRVASSYDALVKMTTSDSSGYARRCGAIALGWLGDNRAESTLEAALKDRDPLVGANARAALDILHDKSRPTDKAVKAKRVPEDQRTAIEPQPAKSDPTTPAEASTETPSTSEAAPTGENLLKNAGFETGDDEPEGWEPGTPVPGVKSTWDKSVHREGKASLCIEKTANRYFPIAQWTQTIERKGDDPVLEVSAQVKAQKMTKAVLDVLFLDKDDQWISHKWAAYIGAKKAGQAPATHDWKPYAGKVDIPPGTARICVALQVYGPGKVWFDNVQARYGSANATSENRSAAVKAAEEKAVKAAEAWLALVDQGQYEEAYYIK